MLALLLCLALLVIWAVGSGGPGGGGGDDQGRERGGDGTVSSITPGPTSSESLISERPGGREEEVGGGTGGTGGGDTDGARGGTGSGGGGTGDSGANGGGSDGAGPDGAAGSGAGGADTGVSGGAEAVPAGSPLPDCRPGSVETTLRSTENRYAPGEKPVFRLTVRNGGDSACKVDFGGGATVFTVIEAGDDDKGGKGDKKVWQSDDCPKGARSAHYRVPAGGTAVRTLEWDRRHSDPAGCATPGAAAKAGTYLVEAQVAGLEKARTSFVLTKD
ncbi:hypothetical protein V1L54_24945 [Streptomyces sp. TRM 70361]|uniref:hypothetical protein n=1 Tax=Streptomyces sp. TRM 70361 TaxID=3116553 RepID=UPI002E7B8D8F|nr:hypothetical protein [Streptomyces sp. TRM 70361]MEE1942612.1 hypothetical protein [Streptomyces sp. TRM 70361]